MGKRSDFKKVDKDFYETIDSRALIPLTHYLTSIDRVLNKTYAEPCYGSGSLHRLIDAEFKGSLKCNYASDKYPVDNYCIERDALDLTKEDIEDCDMIITNPPWTRSILHPMIEHFVSLEKPVWLLFDADWAQTKQATRLINEYCTHILAVGRLKWIPNTTMSGKDNTSWYRFHFKDRGPAPQFYPQVGKYD